MSKTIFDHLKGITVNKVSWEMLSDGDKKSWDDYMITRWLSMRMEYVEYLNEIQMYRSSGMTNENYYNLLLHTLPKKSAYYKYVKRPKTFENKKELLKFISSVFKVSYRESLDIIQLFVKLNLTSEFDELLQKYGIQHEEREKLRKDLFDAN